MNCPCCNYPQCGHDHKFGRGHNGVWPQHPNEGEVEVKVGQQWFVSVKDDLKVATATILEMSRNTVVLQYDHEGGVHRYQTQHLTLVELISKEVS